MEKVRHMPPPRKKKPLTREDIERAMRATRSNRAAARYLNVSYGHYKIYACLYKDEKTGKTLYEMHYNQGGKGIPKFALHRTPGKRYREPALADIVSGRVPATHYNPQKLKYRLIEAGMLKPKCASCGFSGKRLVDGKSPLILMHKDGLKNNWNLDNLEFLCYNCAFLQSEKSPVTEDFVEKQEDFVDRALKNENEVWELDDYQKDYLKQLGLTKEEVKDYDKYISRIWKTNSQ